MVVSAAAATSTADPSPKSAAETTRAAKRTRSRSGRVRTNRSHGDSRSPAMPTPNWKNATASTAKPVNEASRRFASASARGVTKSRKNSAGNDKVGMLNAG